MGKFTKDNRDIYYRKAKEDGYRARSAYKLLQIDEEFGIFNNVERVIDLCAAPGSWSQVLSKILTNKGLFDYKNDEDVRIISIDLQEMAPIENTIQIVNATSNNYHIQNISSEQNIFLRLFYITCILVGDITRQKTVDDILEKFKQNKADLVVCDGAPDVTGFHDIDQYIQTQLLVAALNIANHVLQKNGTFVAKIFKGSDVKFLNAQFKYFFSSVYIFKPKSSRASSVEYFVVCLNYSPPENFIPKQLTTFQEEENKIQLNTNLSDQELFDQKVFKFISCGDLSGFDEP